ncbi:MULTISPECIES: IS66 family transposase [Thiorhodovibrio]|uniref:IS66 family transposase n=1 Tax=Thiorhodovibrio TaxID=61593 RepID=UPI00191158A4
MLTSLLAHWSGLTVFLTHPPSADQVPMDNNKAEETLRTPVCRRKNYGYFGIWC